MKKNSFIAFIPARRNSTRLKNKNLFPIGKKRLIDFTIISSIKSNIFEDIYLSTDSTEIISYVNKKYKSIKTIKRSKKFCENQTTASEVLTDFLFKNKNLIKKNIVYLQPTSPQRTHIDIRKSVSRYTREKARSLISVSEEKINLKFLGINKGKLINLFNKEFISMNFQNLPKTFYTNGAIYIVNAYYFLKKKQFLINPCVPYLMKKNKSVDVDKLSDIKKIWPNLK